MDSPFGSAQFMTTIRKPGEDEFEKGWAQQQGMSIELNLSWLR